ncbi:beta-L-arabinofuranosidase domain-containing protein [Curtobacterium sp. MCBD17_040]|uniref:glycoside hydrolase family 127 protein n=1 Tax=Curtobacterium sp. MCBD17_040 TaxID=2175674 RepID=UPI000DA725C4|nr:beta-L-arabinofuranosidase domain-containing protein [Curtobacterium sp. MCBD17_040]WIB62895.1 glycoside hydrolase family 127 protein [Curtobacterium sp. MCBD17_040]
MTDISTTPTSQRGLVVAPTTGRLRPVPMTDVTITGGFWGDRQATNARATLRHCLEWMERLGWVGNFDRAAEGREAPSAGREFADSEIYKLLEALAWESGRSGDAWVEQTFQDLSARVVAAQQEDGYLNTRFGGPGQQPRWSDLEWGHELYCAGHMIQAAVARARTAGRDAFVEAAIRVADHVCDVFGADGDQRVCGHPEIEVALVELARVTGDERYRTQAALFIERRGDGTLHDPDVPASYFLDDLHVRDADVLRGHAVRALYLAAGAVDLAVDRGDAELSDALRTQWHNTVAHRTYLTGGMGSRHEGESFGDDFELPSDRAYSETCAGVGSIMFSWRLLLADGEERYADLIERTLYNVIATSPDEQGTAFFYVNPLQRNVPGTPAAVDEPSERAASSQRAPWFAVSCCPTNVARTLASLTAYVATVDDDGLQLHQYAEGRIDTTLPDGRTVRLEVATDYPLDGRVRVVVAEDAPEPWTLTLRVPGWAAGSATVDAGEGAETVDGGSVAIRRAWRAGDVVTLDLPTQPRLVAPDERIDALRGTVAVERGPLVLCAESIDQDADRVDAIQVLPGAEPTADGATDAALDAVAVDAPERDWPYAGSPAHDAQRPGTVRLRPYHQWAERGPSTMRVWLPLADAATAQA